MKLKDTTKTFRLSKTLDDQIISESKRLQLPQSIYIRKAISNFMKRTENEDHQFLE